MKADLNSHLIVALNSSITEQVLPIIQSSLDTQGREKSTVMNQRSSVLQS